MKKALVVGCNYLNDPTIHLNGCIDDIVNISALLKEHYGYTCIVQLRDDSTKPEEQPTRNNILTELNKLIAGSSACDEIWFHYSGHGSRLHIQGSDLNFQDDVIVPVDFKTKGFIIDDEIYNIIKNTKCKTFLIMDCCHSASVCELHWMFDCEDGEHILKSVNTQKQITCPFVYCISGCKNDQTSIDAFNTEKKEFTGAFTDALIHVLETKKYKTSLLQLYIDICVYIKSEGYLQTPILSCSSMIPSYTFTPVA